MKKNRKRRLLLKFLIIGTFLGFKISQSDFSLLINDTYSPSFTSASSTISYSGTNFQVTNFITGLDLGSTTSVTVRVFNIGTTGFTSLGLTGSISITTSPTYGTASTGITNSSHLSITYEPYQNSLVSYPIDSLQYQICIHTPENTTNCETGTITYTISNSNYSVSGTNDDINFYIQSGNNQLTIDVLENDIGTGRYISGYENPPLGSIGISGTLAQQQAGSNQKIIFTYSGVTLPSPNPMSISYNVCVYETCDSTDIDITFFIEGTNTGGSSSSTGGIGRSSTGSLQGINDNVVFPIGSGISQITIDALANDIGTGIFLSGIINQPSTGSAIISGNKIVYTYIYSNNIQIHNTYDTVTYQICNPSSLCDNAIINIFFEDQTPITCNDDYRFYNLSGSNGDINITRNVLQNDYYGAEAESGLVIKQLTGQQPTTGTATIISQKTEINYFEYNTNYDIGDTITIGYECCSIYNQDDNCDEANFVILFSNSTSPIEFCDYPGDEDQDGKHNCADSDCDGITVSGGVCEPSGESSCTDNFDNDGDFKTDCQDSDCSGHQACNQTGVNETCNNGIDDDRDYQIDCADSDCDNENGSGGICQFGTETSCDDNFDNDGDQNIDCDDSDCASFSQCQNTGTVEICNNSQDDDSDGKADCADLDCAGETGSGGIVCEPAGETTCNDGKDNDVDGSADCDDSDCSSSSVCQSGGGGGSSEICNNGIDDDTDGFADCFDSDCKNSSVCLSVCGNGIKNSGEECDDGNTSNQDGCNSVCKLESPKCNNISYSFGTLNEINKLTISTLENQSTRTSIVLLDWGDESPTKTNTKFPQNKIYTKLGTYQTQIVLKSNIDGSKTKTCEQTITISSIPGCVDSEATNYNPNATIDDKSCSYNSSNISCEKLGFRVSEKTPGIGETVYFLWTLNNQIKNISFYGGFGTYETDPSSPKSVSYSLPGTYKAELIVNDKHGKEKTCELTLNVGKKGCAYEGALNYNPDAQIDDGSCIFDDEGGYYDDCGNSRLDPGEECDDGNNYNGDGCDSTCFIESGRPPYCGNAIVEIGEECDGGPYCSELCYYYESSIIDEIRKEVCFLNGQCDFGGENNFFFPENIPGVGPDDERLDVKIKKLGYQITQKPNINTDSLPRFTKIEKDNKNFEDPIYWIEQVLPKKYKSYKKFRVAPSIGSVSAIDEIHNPTKLNEFILGKPGDFQEKLLETAVHYAGSAEFGEGGNTVILGHSSQYVLPHQEDQEIGNAFKLLPLLQKNDKFYLVEKINGEYDIHTYRVTNKKIIEPNNSEILDQRNQGHKATLVTCYPIGSTTQRMVIEAEPVSKLVDIRYTELLHQLSAKQKIQLRAIAKKYYSKIDSDNMFELILHRLYLTRTNIKKRNDLTSIAKEKMDTAIQYIIYELTNTHL